MSNKVVLVKTDDPVKPVVEFGIEETFDVIEAAAEIKKAIDLIGADGKVSITDLVYVVAPFRAIVKAIENIKLVGTELLGVDLSEAHEIVLRVQAKFGVDSEAARKLIEHSFTAAYHIKEVYRYATI